MDGLDKLYSLDVTPGDGKLAVDTVLASLTRGRGVIWAKRAGATKWELIKALPRNDNAIFTLGNTDAFRGGHILLVFEMRDASAAGTARYEAIGELLVDGKAVEGSRQRIRGTFSDRIALEAIDWNLQ